MLVAVAITASVVTATVYSNWVREAHAADSPPLLSLVASPSLFTIPPEAIFGMMVSGSGYRITIVNSTKGPVEITDLSFQENIPEDPLIFYPGSTRPVCAVGSHLAANASCYLFVQATNHFD